MHQCAFRHTLFPFFLDEVKGFQTALAQNGSMFFGKFCATGLRKQSISEQAFFS